MATLWWSSWTCVTRTTQSHAKLTCDALPLSRALLISYPSFTPFGRHEHEVVQKKKIRVG